MERNLAVLIDFENLATGCEKEGLGRFDLRAVMRRMKDKGRILVARAYADWGQWNRAKHDLFEQGVQMVEMSTRGTHAKNRADMALCVDAMELAFTREYLDTFVILSGDSDFTPLVTRLKELNKRVIGCGTRGSSSLVFANLCDEFYFYETLKKQLAEPEDEEPEEPNPQRPPPRAPSQDDAFKLLLETLENLQRDEAGAVHGSVIKSSLKRKVPTFNEVELGFRTFTRFLESAAERGLVTLTRDEKAGGYKVELGRRVDPPGRPVAGEAGEEESGREPRRRRRRRGPNEPSHEVLPLQESPHDPLPTDDLPPEPAPVAEGEVAEPPPADVLDAFYDAGTSEAPAPDAEPAAEPGGRRRRRRRKGGNGGERDAGGQLGEEPATSGQAPSEEGDAPSPAPREVPAPRAETHEEEPAPAEAGAPQDGEEPAARRRRRRRKPSGRDGSAAE